MSLGFFAALYLYVFHFDDFSETELVQLSYVWLPLIIFGTHGLIAYGVQQARAAGAPTNKEAVAAWLQREDRSVLDRLSLLFLPSYHGVAALMGGQNPFWVAAAAALLWSLGLIFFFEAIFPSL